jgi:transposase
MRAAKRYPVELGEWSVRLVEDLLADRDLAAAIGDRGVYRVSEQLVINQDTLRGWVKQAQIGPAPSRGFRPISIVGSWSSRLRTAS